MHDDADRSRADNLSPADEASPVALAGRRALEAEALALGLRGGGADPTAALASVSRWLEALAAESSDSGWAGLERLATLGPRALQRVSAHLGAPDAACAELALEVLAAARRCLSSLGDGATAQSPAIEDQLLADLAHLAGEPAPSAESALPRACASTPDPAPEATGPAPEPCSDDTRAAPSAAAAAEPAGEPGDEAVAETGPGPSQSDTTMMAASPSEEPTAASIDPIILEHAAEPAPITPEPLAEAPQTPVASAPVAPAPEDELSRLAAQLTRLAEGLADFGHPAAPEPVAPVDAPPAQTPACREEPAPSDPPRPEPQPLAGVALPDPEPAAAPPASDRAPQEVDAAALPQPEPAPAPPQPELAPEQSPELPAEPPAEAGPTELTPEQMAQLMAGGDPNSLPPAGADDPSLVVGGATELTPEQMAALMAGDAGSAGGAAGQSWGATPLSLSADKIELLQFMVADARGTLDQFQSVVAQLADPSQREEGAAQLADLCAAIDKIGGFFSFSSLVRLGALTARVSQSVLAVPEALLPELLVRVRGIACLLEQHIRGLEVGMEMIWPLDGLEQRLAALLAGQELDRAIVGWHRGDPELLLELDGVCEGTNNPPKPGDPPPPTSTGAAEAGGTLPPAQGDAPLNAGAGSAGPQSAPGQPVAATGAEKAAPTVRVASALIEEMLEMVGQLVMTKNRIGSLTRHLRGQHAQATAGATGGARTRSAAALDELASASDQLATLTSGLQSSMMRARMQPIGRLFERYPRVARDVASLADKQVSVDIQGAEVLVDRPIFDGLAEPVAQVIRHFITTAVELPAQRRAVGKPESATIRLRAENQGRNVMVTISHDGTVPARDGLAGAAVGAGIVDADRADAMTDAELLATMLDPRAGHRPLAAAAAAIAALRGSVRLTFGPAPDGGPARLDFAASLPLSVAIIPAILFAIGAETYALPLQAVEEIAKVQPAARGSIRSRPVLRLREAVLPLIELARLVDAPPAAPGPEREPPPGATPATDQPAASAHEPAESAGVGIVVHWSDRRAAILVDRIVGKQEVVVKELDDATGRGELFSGATIRDDGGISLIFKPEALLNGGEPDGALGGPGVKHRPNVR